MADRALLHRNKLEEFKIFIGDRILPPKGQYEVLRWKNKYKNKPMCIIFDNLSSSEHLSCNDASLNDVLEFIRRSKTK